MGRPSLLSPAQRGRRFERSANQRGPTAQPDQPIVLRKPSTAILLCRPCLAVLFGGRLPAFCNPSVRSLPLRTSRLTELHSWLALRFGSPGAKRKGIFMSIHRTHAIGRRWWTLPTTIAVGGLFGWITAELFTGFNGRSSYDWFVFIGLFIGGPVVGGILTSPGCRWPHIIAALTVTMLGPTVMMVAERPSFIILLPAVIVWVIQVGVLRFFGLPNYRIRPSRRRLARFPLSLLIMGTTVVAIGLAILSSIASTERTTLSMFAFYLGLPLLMMIIGNMVAATKWPIQFAIAMTVSVVALGGYLGMQFGDLATRIPLSLSPMVGRMTDKILFVAPAASLCVTLMVHALARSVADRQERFAAISTRR